MLKRFQAYLFALLLLIPMLCFVTGYAEDEEYVVLTDSLNSIAYSEPELYSHTTLKESIITSPNNTKTYALGVVENNFDYQYYYLHYAAKSHPDKAAMVRESFAATKACWQSNFPDSYFDEPYLQTKRLVVELSLARTQFAADGDHAAYAKRLTEVSEALLTKNEGYFSKLNIYFDLLLEQGNHTRLQELFPPKSTAVQLTHWFDANLDKLPWLTRDELIRQSSVGLLLDNADGLLQGTSVFFDSNGTAFIGIDGLLIHSGSICDKKSSTDNTVVYRSAANTYEITAGDSHIVKNGVVYPLSAPIFIKHSTYFAPIDVLESCIPKNVTLYTCGGNEHLRNYFNYLITDSADPYTTEQLTFALAMAAPLHVHNNGTSSWGGIGYDRDTIDAQIDELLPIVSSARTSANGDRWLGVQTKTLPATWGITNRESLMGAIGMLVSNEHDEQDTGGRAWDLSRAAQLSQWGFLVDYLTREETIDLQISLARSAQKEYRSWEHFYESYLEGYLRFSPPTTIGEDGVDDRIYITNYLLSHPFITNLDWNMSLDIPPPPPAPEPESLPESLSEPVPDSESAPQPPTEATTPTDNKNIMLTVSLAVLFVGAVVVLVVRKKKNKVTASAEPFSTEDK